LYYLEAKLLELSRRVFLVLFTLFLISITASAAEWKSWNDGMRGKNGVLKVKYLIESDSSFKFEVYKNKDWSGNGNDWEKIDHFTINRKKKTHKKDIPDFYSTLIGKIRVNYKIDADFAKKKVRSSGFIISPIPKTFPVRTQKHEWNQDFFSIPEPKAIITTQKNGYTFVEVSEIWMGTCSRIACGPWVQFPGYSETHRYNAYIPKVGPVIIQLWKGFCPSLSQTSKEYNLGALVNLINLGDQFPGGIGAEVGVYRPIGKNATMYDAATRQTFLGIGEWEPVVDPDLKISFQLIDPGSKKVLVDAEEKNTWWRTKWMTSESFERYKKKNNVPAGLKDFDFVRFLGRIPPPEVLSYELHYTINGIKQTPWKDDSFPGEYPEIGFNGLWRIQDLRYLLSPRVFEVLEIYNNGKEIELSLDRTPLLKVPLNGTVARGHDYLGSFEISAELAGEYSEKLFLDFTYVKEEFDLKKEALKKMRANLPEMKNKGFFEKKVDELFPEFRHDKIEFKHRIELEILLPSHRIALRGVAPVPIIYNHL
jgi:hypothetical protein